MDKLQFVIFPVRYIRPVGFKEKGIPLKQFNPFDGVKVAGDENGWV